MIFYRVHHVTESRGPFGYLFRDAEEANDVATIMGPMYRVKSEFWDTRPPVDDFYA